MGPNMSTDKLNWIKYAHFHDLQPVQEVEHILNNYQNGVLLFVSAHLLESTMEARGSLKQWFDIIFDTIYIKVMILTFQGIPLCQTPGCQGEGFHTPVKCLPWEETMYQNNYTIPTYKESYAKD